MTKALFKKLLVFCLLALGLGNSYGQIALWTYEPSQAGAITAPTPNSGVNMATGSSAVINGSGGTITPMLRTGMTGTGCGDQTTGTNAWAFEPFGYGSVSETNGAQFKVSTAGYENIYFTWDQRWSNTAPNTLRLKYTIDGTNWVNFVMTAANTTVCLGTITASGCFETNTTGDYYRRISANFSSITGVKNNPLFAVRILASTYQSTGQFRQCQDPSSIANIAGTWRFDNVTFSGTLIPGPNPSVISGTTPICAGDSANIAVTMTGGLSPFRLVYTDGTTNYTVNNYVSGTPISVSPTSTKTYTIVSVNNLNNVNYGLGTGNTGSAVITVNALPTVTAAAISACDAGPTALTTGSPAGGTYSIPNPYSGPSTTFTYSYTDPSTGCSKTTAAYAFTRNTAVTFSVQPSTASQTTCQGTPFSSVSVTASGTGPLTYQWYSNTTASTTGGTPLLTAAHVTNGSKTATYIPLSTVVGNLYYYVVVTNTCGSVKSANTTGLFTVSAPTVSGSISPAQTICGGSTPANISLTGQTGSVVKWQRADDSGFTVNVQDIAVTATTLSGASIGAITVTTYIRAVVKNGSCLTANTTPIQLLVKSTTWNGGWSAGAPDSVTTAIFESDYTSSGNINACSMVVNSGNVVINPGHIVTLQNSLTVNGGSMTFEDSASLIQLTGATNSGFINYKRNTTPIKRYDYTYWSSPVDYQIMANLSPQTLSDKYFWWNPAIYNWANIVAPGISPMEVGKGYIIRGPQTYDINIPAVYSGTFTGTPNNGEYPVTIAVSGANNLNLLGNPYPSALSADLFMSDSENAATLGTGTTIYLWTHNSPMASLQYSFSDYATYNYMGGTGTAAAAGANNAIPNGYIAAGQGFFIKGIASGTAKFKNGMRVGANNNQFYRTAQTEKSRFWLELSNNQNAFKQMMVGYASAATNDFDTAYDAIIANGTNPVQLYSILNDNRLTIQGRGLPFEQSQIIPLGFSVTTAGTYTITMSRFDGIFESQQVFLKDNMTGEYHDLHAGAFTFETSAGTIENRFEIHYQAEGSLSVENPGMNQQAIIYQNNDELFVHSAAETIRSVTLFDMTGRRILERQNNQNLPTISIQREFAKQPLIVRVAFENGTEQNQKVVF
ncbi:hypothetical protein [Flavobacterium silvaticum]|uniref:Ig-like domain-containing protein n=1 Tax=Flavobacterium silvaticum TaxID=1852020 RepID=A0A972JHR0_9FLAO|nr:hypothetical protein [Flavobacterium silvaticum]NMH26502.1 hypothetical protein [Flavobacterium silvaticum]